MEKVEFKLDGMIEMLRVEIPMEIMKGIEGLQMELSKSNQQTSNTMGEVVSGNQVSGVVNMPSPDNTQGSENGSFGAQGVSVVEKQTQIQSLGS